MSRLDNHNHDNHGNHGNHAHDNVAMDVLESPKPVATYFRPHSGTSLESLGSDEPPTFSVNVTGAPGTAEAEPEGEGGDGIAPLRVNAPKSDNSSRISIGPIMLSIGDDSEGTGQGAYDNMYSAGTFKD